MAEWVDHGRTLRKAVEGVDGDLVTTPPPDPRAAAVAASLAPYRWQTFTTSMLARWAVATVDRFVVEHLVSVLSGGPGEEPRPVEPAPNQDERVEWLADMLNSRAWRGLTVHRLAGDLVDELDRRQAQRDVLDAELTQLLSGD